MVCGSVVFGSVVCTCPVRADAAPASASTSASAAAAHEPHHHTQHTAPAATANSAATNSAAVSRTATTGSAANDATNGAASDATPTPPPAFQPFFTLYAEGWHNASGGRKNTGWWNTLADAGFTLDVEKLGGPQGMSFYANLHWVESRPHAGAFAEHTGAANPVSGIMSGSDHLRVFNFHLLQEFADGEFQFKIGQLAIDDAFMLSDSSCFFLNSAFGAMPSQVSATLTCSNAAFPIYGVAAPGAYFRWKPSEKFSWQTGLYYGGPGADDRDNYGWSYDRASHSGAIVFSEATATTEIAGHAAAFKLGVTAHSAKFPVFDGGAAKRGLFSAYMVQDIALVAGKDAAAPPAVAFFAREGYVPQSDRAVANFYADAGFVFNGLVPTRPNDVFGAAVSHTRYGRDFRRADGSIAASETTLEFTYAAKLLQNRGWLKDWTLIFDVQILFSPVARDGGSRRTAIVPGVRSVWSF
ncbi:MAG: carbohydrate porin [Puniceicoccales bacterium]|jgi:porin|nr:carbohydrate porin [Puniceicoccales bacterium]